MLGSVIAALVSAFVTGALARFAVPGPDPMPAWLTISIGLAGTLIGGGIVYALVGPKPAWVGVGGFLAAVALVVLYRHFVQRRPFWGRGAYRFPERGVGVGAYRERLHRAGIDPDRIGLAQAMPVPAAAARDRPVTEEPTENPAHFLQLLEELHDAGVLDDGEYDGARMRLLERLRN